MAKPVKLVVAEIGRRLATAAAAGSPNQMSPAELRDLAIEYLAEKDEEQVAIPPIAGQSHWNLWFVDARLEDTLFAVLVFWPDRLEFVCGTGYAIELCVAGTAMPQRILRAWRLSCGRLSGCPSRR